MNALRNIFSSRTLNYLRQNGQNALINATQQPAAVGDASNVVPPPALDKAHSSETPAAPLSIPRSILEACHFTAQHFDTGRSQASSAVKQPGSLSPTTLKHIRRMQRKMELVYRCKLCNTRNTKTISEAAFYSGVVILQCDGCAVDHLIKDNLGLFANSKNKCKNIEELLSERTERRVRIIKVNERDELI